MASPSIARTEHRTHPRAYLRVALIVLILLIIVLPHLLWRLFNRQSPFATLFLRWSGWAAGANVRTTGTPITRNVLYIANHLSWLDILALSGRTGTAFVAKADMDQNNTVYVKRDSRATAHAQATSLQDALLAGQPVTLFPEGTTVGGSQLLPFRSSLIAAVVPAPEGVSIQPVAIDYGGLADEIAWVEEESVGHNALRIMSRKGGLPITLHFLKPLDHADFADRKAIAAHSRAEIAEALGDVGLIEDRLF
jgi:lyso-ornithine lipid O-acyltransferase